MKNTRVVILGGSLAVGLALAAVLFLRYQQPKYVFVDGGAHVGESVKSFKSSPIYKEHTWHIIAFEANPNLIPEFSENAKDVTLLNQAIWTKDGWIKFYLGEDTLSSSILKRKKTGNLSKVPTKVECVDFGRWLERNFDRKDQIIVKLDIEGAEYAVLNKMLVDGTIDFIDKLYVEFHNVKVNVPEEKDREILSELKKRGIPVDATGSEVPGDWFGKEFPESKSGH